MSESLLKRLDHPGPKRILAMDGGGIRGIYTLGFLEKIEAMLRERSGNPQLVLADYFDFVGGTSTGSIIASAISIGKSVSEIKELYMILGKEIFKPRLFINKYLGILGTLFGSQYSTEGLEYHLSRIFGDMELGSEEIRTGLCVVTKRADTRSTWPFINHPSAKYYGKKARPARDGHAEIQEKSGNKDLLLRMLVRASTAAPTQFDPEEIKISDKMKGAFIDGGLSSANNPALYMFLISTLKCFPFHWETGADKILLCSVGTGASEYKTKPNNIMKKKLVGWLAPVVDFLMEDISELNQIVLQSMAYTPQPTFIDGEMGDLKEENIAGNHLLHYLRYNVHLDKEFMDEVSMGKYNHMFDDLHSIDNPALSPIMEEISHAFAADRIKSNHFPEIFDPWEK